MRARSAKTECSLLCLPGELRNRIYFFYVFAEERYELERNGLNTHMFPYIDRRKRLWPHSYRLGLLSVCRQIHAEVALLAFIIGTIEIDKIETLEELPFPLTTAQCSASRRLRLVTPLGGNVNIVKLFVSKSRKSGLWLRDYLPGVRKVEVEVVGDYTQQRQRCQSGTRFNQRRNQTKQWLTGGDGTEIEVIFSGHVMCGNEIVRANRQWWERECSC